MYKLDLTQKLVSLEMVNTTDEKGVVTKKPKQIKDPNGNLITVREMILSLLVQNFVTDGLKEAFWIKKIGMKVADAGDFVELSEEHIVFLRKIVERNKFFDAMRAQFSLYTPYEQAEFLTMLGYEEDAAQK